MYIIVINEVAGACYFKAFWIDTEKDIGQAFEKDLGA